MKKPAPLIITEEQNDSNHANAIVMVIELIQSVNINDPHAKLNINSISDNNGGRILL